MKDGTITFKSENLMNQYIREIVFTAYQALEEKGYNATNQLVGYLISGDPAYITSHNDARKKITKVEREDIMEVLLCDFLESREV